MKNSQNLIILILVSWCLPPAATAAQLQNPETIERITVKGDRGSYHYYRQLERAKLDFIQAYNERNTIGDFAIDCSPRAAIGSHIKKMECMPRYFNRELGHQARAFIDGSSRRNNSNAEYVIFLTQKKKQQFEKHIAKLSQESAELQDKRLKVEHAMQAYEQRKNQSGQ